MYKTNKMKSESVGPAHRRHSDRKGDKEKKQDTKDYKN